MKSYVFNSEQKKTIGKSGGVFAKLNLPAGNYVLSARVFITFPPSYVNNNPSDNGYRAILSGLLKSTKGEIAHNRLMLNSITISEGSLILSGGIELETNDTITVQCYPDQIIGTGQFGIGFGEVCEISNIVLTAINRPLS